MKDKYPTFSSEWEMVPGSTRRKAPLWLLLLGDVVLAALILGIFMLFHTVLPGMTMPDGIQQEASSGSIAAAPVPTAHFTDTVVSTESSYSSPNISIELSTRSMELNNGPVTYHVADIYVSDAEYFQTYFATGDFDFYEGEPSLLMDRNSSAIVAINGDYCNTQKSGLLVRNGELIMTGQTTCDICVLYRDGSLETYGPDEYTVEEIMAKEPWQVWKFGPELLDEEGLPHARFNTSDIILSENPRSGLGYYEPGHYCFVVVDGRQKDHSEGLTMYGFAKLFSELGCIRAYNMDGGASAVMTFNDQIYSRPCSGGRNLGDILLIRELEDPKED